MRSALAPVSYHLHKPRKGSAVTSTHRIAVLAAFSLLTALPTHAADRRVQMKVPPPVSKTVAAMPLIADPADDAERRINAALQRLTEQIRKTVPTCKNDQGKQGSWERTVEAPMRGPGFISFVIRDEAFCGGAHPAAATMAIVYDLKTGRPVDWTILLPPSLTGSVALAAGMDGVRPGEGAKMVTLASPRLYDLYIAGYALPDADATAQDRADCKEAVQRVGGNPPAMMVWLSAKPAGLALQYDLSHVVQNCAVPVIIPLATLRREGAKPALLDAIKAAGHN